MLGPPPLPRTLEASIRDLSSPKPQTRASAVADLVRHAVRDETTRGRAIPLFEEALRDPAPAVRSAAAVALADVRGHEALPSLLVAVEDPDQLVRQMAINALGEIGDRRAFQRLERALGDERPEVRYQATIAFCRVAEADREDVVRALSRALGDPDPAIRYIALRLAEDRALFSAPLVARAKDLLEGPNASVGLAAAIYLARTGDEQAIAFVLRVVRREVRAPEAEDEQAAIELAGELGLTSAIPDLERRAWGFGRWIGRDPCAWHAKIALARLGHVRARAEILRDLGSIRRATRDAAVVAAGRARLVDAKERIARLAAQEGVIDADLAMEALAKLDEGPQ